MGMTLSPSRKQIFPLYKNITDQNPIFSYAGFVSYFFEKINCSPYKFTKYNRSVLDHIQSYLCDYESHKYMVINMCPSFGKSTITGAYLTAFLYALSPRKNNMYLFGSSGLCSEYANLLESILSDPDYRQFYPYVRFRRENFAHGHIIFRINDHYTTHISTVESQSRKGFNLGVASIIGTLSGIGVVDDPDNEVSVTSKKKTDRRRSAADDLFDTRRRVPVPCILVQQRIANNDTTGYFHDYKAINNKKIEGTTFNVKIKCLTIPTLIDFDCIETIQRSLPNFDHVDLNPDKKEGDITHHNITNEEILEKKSNANYTWLTQYQQMVIDARGGFFMNLPMMAKDPKKCKFINVICTIDMSDSIEADERKGDFNACQWWGKFRDSRNKICYMLLEQIRMKGTVSAITEEIKHKHEILSKYYKRKIIDHVEKKSRGSEMIHSLKNNDLSAIRIDGKFSNMSKVDRAMRFLKLLESQSIYTINRIHTEFVTQFKKEVGEFNEFGTNKHDDLVDCASYMAIIFLTGRTLHGVSS